MFVVERITKDGVKIQALQVSTEKDFNKPTAPDFKLLNTPLICATAFGSRKPLLRTKLNL